MATTLDNTSDIDDGFQDVLDENQETETMRIQESLALERRMKTVGIRDGVELGKHETLQEGFDQGFSQGARQSCRFGRLRGALETARVCGLFDETMITQVQVCLSQLRSLEMDTRVHHELLLKGTEAEEQATNLLKCIGMDMTTSFK